MGNYELLKAAINEVIKANGRQEITGEVLNQVLLSMVNSLGAGYQCMGVATPSTNPGTPDQNVFYFATQAGTYTNFDAIVLQAGISVLIWDGDWASQTWFTVDSAPTNNSQNLIASGAVFNALKLDGGAYDVTAHNSGATFASLSELLNSENLNTLIPTEIRHGGMSIKFVQSSDKKYVQYRLTADEFSTTESDWQGVDTKPAAGSKNFVESGGVYLPLGEIKGEYTIPSQLFSRPSHLLDGIKLFAGQYVHIHVEFASAITAGWSIGFRNESNQSLGNINIDANTTEYDGLILVLDRDLTNPWLRVYAGDLNIAATITINAESSISRVPYESVFNINDYTEASEPYTSTATARGLVSTAIQNNCYGKVITYLMKDGRGVYWRKERCVANVFNTSDSAWELISPLVSEVGVQDEIIFNTTSSIPLGSTRKIVECTLSPGIYVCVITGGTFTVSFKDSNYIAIFSRRNVSEGIPFVVNLGSVCNNLYIIGDATENALPFGVIIKKAPDKQNIEQLIYNHIGLPNAKSICDIQPEVEASLTRYVYNTNLQLTENKSGFFIVTGVGNGTFTLTDSSYRGLATATFRAGEVTPIDIPSATKAAIINFSSSDSDRVMSFKLGYSSIMNYLNSLYKTNLEQIYIDKSYTIPAGSYRYTSIILPSRDNDQLGTVILSGMDGIVTFAYNENNRYVSIVKYVVYNGIEKEVVIPKNTYRVYVATIDGNPVSSDKSFHIKIIGIKENISFDVIEKILKFKRYLPIMQNLTLTRNNSGTNQPDTTYRNLVLASITDVHNDLPATRSFLEFSMNYSAYIDDIIGLGDYVRNSINDHTEGAEPFILDTIDNWGNIIKTIGNHDAYDTWNPLTYLTEQQCYDLWMKDDIANWGVEYTANKTYFYKDYPSSNIRTIYLDYMHWDDENDADGQIAWLRNILYGDNENSAIAKGYHVVICIHYSAKSENSGDIVPFNVNFIYNDHDVASTGFNSTLPDIVNEFMTDYNGIFCCYLTGHRHFTYMGTYQNYPKQIIIVQPNALNGYPRDTALTIDTDYQMQFFIYSIDYKKQYIRIYKPGANYNRNMQHVESILIEYGDNPKVVDSF